MSLNPFPLLISLSSFNFMLNLLFFLKSVGSICLLYSFILLTLTSFFWWINYSLEFLKEGKNSDYLESTIKNSVVLFISSEVFFFFSFFWSYFHFFLSPSMEVGLEWPPSCLLFFDCSNFPLSNTLILLLSGVAVTISHFCFTKGFLNSSCNFLFVTIFLGGMFTYFQYVEYSNSFYSLNDSIFGCSFFMLTGFHGIHVLVGSIFLLYCYIYSGFFRNCSTSLLTFELCSWYWHFVDVVWIFLYFFIYYLNN